VAGAPAGICGLEPTPVGAHKEKRFMKAKMALWGACLFTSLALSPIPGMSQPAVEDSYLTVPVRANLTTLSEKLNQLVPERLADIREPNMVCVEAQWLKTKGIPKCRMEGIKIYCEDTWIKTKTTPEVRCDVSGWVNRGRITVTGNGQALRVAVPVSAQVTAKALVQETARAEAIVHADITPRIGPDWSMSAQITPDLTWTSKPALELFGLVKITITGQVEPKLKEKLKDFAAIAVTQLEALDVKGKVQTGWTTVQQPIRVVASPPAYARFAPTEAFFSGLSVEDNILKMTVGARGMTSVALGAPASAPLTPLPPLKFTPSSVAAFKLVVPVIAPYERVVESANAQFPAGYEVFLTKDDQSLRARLFNPRLSRGADGRLNVTIGVETEHKSKFLKAIDIFGWLEPKGDLTFKAHPRVDDGKRIVGVKNLEYDSTTNSRLFDALVDLAGIPLVRDHVERALQYNYGPDIDAAVATVNGSLSTLAKPPIRVNGSLSAVKLTGIDLTDSAIQLNTELLGAVSADVGL
jgi:hypothetical protein